MSMDQELLQQFLERLQEKYTGVEIVDILRDAEILTDWDVINSLTDYIIEGKELFEL